MYSLKRKIVMLIVVSLWIYIAFIRPFKNELPLINEDDYMKPGSLELPNIVVHLDLQGMPPRIPYLLEFLDRIRPIGANGLLIEYGDTYPFDGFIKYMSAEEAYNEEELSQFLKEANHKGFNIIPFVDTLVHLDLAFEDFRHSREPGSTDSICPTESQSTAILTNLLEQIINFHAIIPLEYIHIGCGIEKLNYFKACKGRSRSDFDVYTEHISTVGNIAKMLKPSIKILMWDDIFRNLNAADEAKAQRLYEFEVVCRDYNPKINISLHNLRTYEKVFGNTWAASAFKGADGPTSTIPNIEFRYKNHYSWLTLIRSCKDTYNFKGLILTGRSRYGRDYPACDILPAAMPSIIINLILVRNFRSWNKRTYSMSSAEYFMNFQQYDMKNDLNCFKRMTFTFSYELIRDCFYKEYSLIGNLLCSNLQSTDLANALNFVAEDYHALLEDAFGSSHSSVSHYCKNFHEWKLNQENLAAELMPYYANHKVIDNYSQFVWNKNKDKMELLYNFLTPKEFN